MSHGSQSFIPVRQPQNEKRLDSSVYNDTQIWTATRCQHLLRPITSRIELLKKDLVRFTSRRGSSPPCQGNTGTIPDLNIARFKRKSITGDNDACWRPARKRIRKTYSTRVKLKDDLDGELVPRTLAKSKQGNHGRTTTSLPGEIYVPTPILNRSQVAVANSPQRFVTTSSATEVTKEKLRRDSQSRYTLKDEESYFQLAKTMRRFRTSIAPERYKIYEGIYNALEALLRATLPGKERPRMFVANHNYKSPSLPLAEEGIFRSRSLLSMCLRAVPNYIKEGERQASELEDKGYRSAFHAGSISAATYSDLESLGTSCSGWTHLKSVVRAHGVQSICEAIRQGLIDASFGNALVMLCTHASAPYDAEVILSSLLIAHKYPHPQSSYCHFLDIEEMLPLVTLDRFVRYTGHSTFYHRQMTRLIVNELLPLSWLGTQDCSHLWTSVFRALSNDPYDRDATAFLTVSVPLVLLATASPVGERGGTVEAEMLTTLNATVSSTLITLSAMSILHISHTNKILQLLRIIFLECQFGLSKFNGNPAVLIATTNIIVGLQLYEDMDSMRSFIEALTQNSQIASISKYVKEDIPDFICTVSLCCGRASSDDGFEHLVLMLERLKTFASLGSADERVVVWDIIANTAFAFAQQVRCQKSVEYAQYIGKQMQVGNNTKRMSQNVGGIASSVTFQWEDGIGEWVTASPLSLTEYRESKSSWSEDESDLETPIRPNTKRCKSSLTIPQNLRNLRYGHCLKTRVSDLGPISPINGDEGLDPLKRERYQSRKKLAPQDESLWTHSRSTKHGSGKSPTSRTCRREYDLVCVSQGWRCFASSDDELISLSSPVADTTGRVTVNVRNRSKGIIKKQNSRPESSEDELGR